MATQGCLEQHSWVNPYLWLPQGQYSPSLHLLAGCTAQTAYKRQHPLQVSQHTALAGRRLNLPFLPALQWPAAPAFSQAHTSSHRPISVVVSATKPSLLFRSSPASSPHLQTGAQTQDSSSSQPQHSTSRHVPPGSLSPRSVLGQHRKSRFRALQQDQQHCRTQCKATCCGCTDPVLPCYRELPRSPSAVIKLPVHLHKLFCSLQFLLGNLQAPCFFLASVLFAHRSRWCFSLSFFFPDQSVTERNRPATSLGDDMLPRSVPHTHASTKPKALSIDNTYYYNNGFIPPKFRATDDRNVFHLFGLAHRSQNFPAFCSFSLRTGKEIHVKNNSNFSSLKRK